MDLHNNSFTMMLSGLARVSKSVFVAAAVRCLSTHSRSVLECVGDGADRREGNKYWVKKEEVEAFHRDGYLSLPGVVTEDEILEIEVLYLLRVCGSSSHSCSLCPPSSLHTLCVAAFGMAGAGAGHLHEVYEP